MGMTRSRFLALALAAIPFAPLSAGAADWKPSGTMQVIVTYGPGGAYDVLSRAMSKYWEQYFGVKVVVQNLPGAGGALGMDRVVTSKPDGLTIGFTSQGTYLGEMMAPSFSWKVADVPIPLAAMTQPYVVSTGSNSRFKTWADVRKSDRPIKFGLAAQLSTELVIIKDLVDHGREVNTGTMSTQAIATGVQAGDLDLWMTVSSDTLMDHVRAGNIRPLLTVDDVRAPHLPDTPNLVEMGMPARWKDVTSTRIWFMPLGTPPEVVAATGKRMSDILNDPEFKAWAKERGFLEALMTAEQAKASLAGFHGILKENEALLKKYGG